MSRRLRVLVPAAALLLVGLTPSAGQASDRAPDAPAPGPAATTGPAPALVEAMRRDLGLTAAQVDERLRTEATAPVVERRLHAKLGPAFAGAWIPPGAQRLTVAVTDAALAPAVRAEGADVAVVARSQRTLDAVKHALDRRTAAADPRDVHGWHVDVARNSVVVTARPDAAAEAVAYAKASGVPTDAIRVVTSPDAPRPLYDIRGGDQYVINGNTLCSVGFAVVGGFVTAGHCGGVGSPTLGFNNVSQGTFAGSSFPGNDYGWVRTNGSWTPQPWVNNHAGGNVTVAGSQDAAIGSSVCRSGRTTGWRCGTILGRNETVNYPQGAVSGLTRSNACAEGGDSGGAWISGNQAQGVTSGGSGNCSTGGTTWFQPVNEILGVYGLSLVTTGGGGSRLISNWNNRCIDVPNSNFSDGIPLQTWTCNGTNAQAWSFTGGTLRTQNNMCVDVAWGSTANGATIQIATCSGNPAQQFVLSAAGDLVNPQANKCVDIRDWNNSDGARLQLWDCAGTANQKWRRG
ncbi:ricin-type beta-trefoil lectin domain protein [Micromonospora peucetia]|uniref:Ricin-type beta-trefoil lectin domain protein n=1 Tax=Micromonospora peucetia TaxID=47871 RepID=A0A1C6W6T1_9ACTN|nr:ricin-type beta-trefoil lectin domain protein [Micromonospora peucetia]WSA33057.1 ricin-type beta-trefoil lectin domain protein [Micromonospora peucetia]SCL74074.1 streptogrisin C. Serine peptidase. MEROPS family S01A [Micromonospora peucetia]